MAFEKRQGETETLAVVRTNGLHISLTVSGNETLLLLRKQPKYIKAVTNDAHDQTATINYNHINCKSESPMHETKHKDENNYDRKQLSV